MKCNGNIHTLTSTETKEIFSLLTFVIKRETYDFAYHRKAPEKTKYHHYFTIVLVNHLNLPCTNIGKIYVLVWCMFLPFLFSFLFFVREEKCNKIIPLYTQTSTRTLENLLAKIIIIIIII